MLNADCRNQLKWKLLKSAEEKVAFYKRPEGIATADSYSAATRTVILDSLPGQFTTDDMKAIAVKVGKTLRTVRRQIKRAIESGEVQMIRAGEYRKM